MPGAYDTMTSQEKIEKSEHFAAVILRVLAIAGLVALLAFVAWIVIQGMRLAPQAGGGLSAAVSAVSSIFRSAPEESLVIELDTRTIAADRDTTIRWAYEGEDAMNEYRFSYSCNRSVVLRTITDEGINDLACGEVLTVSGTSLTVSPKSEEYRFADIELSVSVGDLSDTTLVTVVNTRVSTDAVDDADANDAEADTGDSTDATDSVDATNTTDTTNTTENTHATDTPAPVTPAYRAPADLVLNITDTGVYIPVAGEDTFFPIDPIPSDRRAGVVFTVTNRGAVTSGAWAFKATVPTDGDAAYEYTSPLQNGIRGGTQVEFTLGFDDLPEDTDGVVRIELVTTDAGDRSANNTDAVAVEFE